MSAMERQSTTGGTRLTKKNFKRDAVDMNPLSAFAMERLLTNEYNEELRSNSRHLDVGVEIDDADVEAGIDDANVEVGTDEGEDIIHNFEGQNDNNFESNNFGVDEWMRQLQQQPEGLIGQAEASLTSPQHQQFRLPYEQTIALSIPSPVKNININSSQNEIESPNQDELRLQEPQESHAQQALMPGFQSLFDGVDITAISNLLQQQQQNLLSPPLQAQSNEPHPQQMATPNLQESLFQLQKLQAEQQKILKNIGHTGLVNPNSLSNPLESLLTTLIGQISSSGNNNNTGDNIINMNRNTINNTMDVSLNNSGTLAWEQIGATQQQQLTNNSLHNTAGMQQNITPQMQQQQQIEQHQQYQVGFAGTNSVSLESQQPQQLQQNMCDDPRQQSVSNSFNKINSHPDMNSSRDSNCIEYIITAPIPIIRRSEKKKKEKPIVRSFPTQLWDAMMAEGPSNDDAFEWLPDGKSFVVVDSELFCKEILDRQFKQSKYGSFVRKLHRWGFIRLTSGTGTDCFHHPLFKRSRPDLVKQVKCNSRNPKDGKKGHNAYARGEVQESVQPSLMGVEKFIRAKVVSTEIDDFLI